MEHLAHITEIDGKKQEQTLCQHCRNTANYVGEKLKSIGFYHTAYLAGLLHDMGKAKAEYQDYLSRAANGEKVRKGLVNHTFCAVIYLFRRYHTDKTLNMRAVICEILAYAIGSHHGQFDCVTLDNESGFEHRIDADCNEIGYEESVANFLRECASESEIDKLFTLAQKELQDKVSALKTQIDISGNAINFLLGLIARMVLSALIDADRRDTAEFMSGKTFTPKQVNATLWEEQLAFLEEKTAGFDRITPINKARSYFSDCCKNFAQTQTNGIYRLTLPTGGGKTLASLRFALAHAQKWNKKRILFVIPLLTILEQNSKVIQAYIKDKALITEHHSNVVQTYETQEELDIYETLCETWESPIVITTMVQLLNTLFLGRTTAIRRMSALTDTVIVIDEIQSLPRKTMNMFIMALNFLAYGCGATIVLSSATQPCFDKLERKIHYAPPEEIVPYNKPYFDLFKRTNIIDKTTAYGMTQEELADFTLEILEENSSVLVICNTKANAAWLYKELQYRCEGWKIYHLSAAMCMQHRTDVLEKINLALKNKEKLLCLSTQLVEAGVDFSFEAVIRIQAGIDNIAQSAGRCNRNNDFDKLCPVYVVNLQDKEEKLSMLEDIQLAQYSAAKLQAAYKQSPENFDNDLLSEKSILTYYQFFFGEDEIKKQFDFSVKIPKSNPSEEKLYNLLADNKNHLKRPAFKGQYVLNQAFKTAGNHFQVFDENTTDVIVPYGEKAENIIADLKSAKAQYDINFVKDCLERAKPYTIHIFEYQRQKLMEDKMIYTNDKEKGRFLILNPACYGDTGLSMDEWIT